MIECAPMIMSPSPVRSPRVSAQQGPPHVFPPRPRASARGQASTATVSGGWQNRYSLTGVNLRNILPLMHEFSLTSGGHTSRAYSDSGQSTEANSMSTRAVSKLVIGILKQSDGSAPPTCQERGL